MEIRRDSVPAEESVGSTNTGHCKGHCKRRLSYSFNSDTSESCNFKPAKYPRRKVVKKMAGPSHELGWEETEVLETQYLYGFKCIDDLSPSDIDALLEEAAEVVAGCPLSNKCYANISFSIAECEIIARALLNKHNLHIRDHQIKQKLESLYFAFEEYCKYMKAGVSNLSFYWNDGTVDIESTNYQMCDPILSKLHFVQNTWKEVISNFAGLRTIYPFVWDKYFKNISKKRSGCNMQSSSTKRSRGSCSSVNFNGGYGEVINRLRELLGNGEGKRLAKRYVEGAKMLFAHNHVESQGFLALDDEDAKDFFLSKIGGY